MPATAIAAHPIRPTAAGRILDYLCQLFPPWVYVPSGVASFLAVYLSLQALCFAGPLRLSWRAAAGALSVVLFSLLLRIYDELKDADSDRRLAREGDPRYRDRAIVTGHVREEDLVALKRAVLAALVIANAPLGFPLPLLPFAAALGILWLSSRWFFWPGIQRNLLLAFATHNPLTLVIAAYVVAISAADFGAGAVRPMAIAVVLAAWLPIAAWELSRKIRVPEQETRYQTYSLLLGWRVAAWLPALAVGCAAACFLWVARATALAWPFSALVAAAALAVFAACARFRLWPTPASANLRPFVEAFTLISTAGLPIALWISRGIG